MHSVAPTCSVSRAGLLTGQYPFQCNMFDLAHRGGSLNDYSKHLIHTLKPAGYQTALIGFQHLVNWPQVDRLGYDQVLGQNGAHGCKIAPLAVDWLTQHSHDAKPFFLSVGLTQTHRVFPDDIPESDARYLRPPAPFPDTDAFRQDMAAYVASLEAADTALGQILDALEVNGLKDNTLIICTTDHGLPFPTMKNNLTDHGTGVLFILAGPGIPQGEVTDALLSQIDVYPTLCDYLNIDAPHWLEGESFLPVIQGQADQVHEHIITQSNYHAGKYHPYRCIRTTRYVYIQGYQDNEYSACPKSDASLSEAQWLDQGWGDDLGPKERLFDTFFDPHERVNLAGHQAYESIKKSLKNQLHTQLTGLEDPILEGALPSQWALVQASADLKTS